VIVETEAFEMDDPASHRFSGPSPRNQALVGHPGGGYVDRCFGMHWCLNFVCREEGHGAGVLIRAIEPTHGIDRMQARRGMDDVRLLCSGPGKIGQALAITHDLNGHRLDREPFRVLAAPTGADVATGPRIGISKAVDLPWRFGLAGSRFVSAKFASPHPKTKP
jgi:DNA-3-methyladenine glycosylase